MAFGAADLFILRTAHAQAEFRKKEIELASRQQAALPQPKELTRAKPSGPALPLATIYGIYGLWLDKRSFGFPESGPAPRYLLALIKNTDDDDPEKPDYLYRLAELYAAKHTWLDFSARNLDQKILEA